MNKKQSSFFLFFQGKKKYLIIVFTIVLMIIFSCIFPFRSIYLGYKLTPHFDLDNILNISFLGIYLSIPQIIASNISKNFKKYLYFESGKKILSMISSISLYFVLNIIISFMFYILPLNTFTSSSGKESFLYLILGIAPYIFIICLVSFIIGIIPLIVSFNINNSDRVIIIEKISFKIYFLLIIPIFIGILFLVPLFILFLGLIFPHV